MESVRYSRANNSIIKKGVYMKIRNKQTGQIFEVLPGTLFAKNIFEEIKDDEIKVGAPKVEFEIEETIPEVEEAKSAEKPAKTAKKLPEKPAKKTRKSRKGAKKNGKTSTK